MKKKNACLHDSFNDTAFIKRLCQEPPHPDKDKIIDYLESGVLFGQTSVHDNMNGESFGTTILTDGTWIWDNLLTEYVENRNLKIEDAFLQHMKNNQWEVPELDMDDPRTYEY